MQGVFFTQIQQSRDSAHEIEIAQRFQKNRGHAPRFFYLWREKVSAWELSDDSCSAQSEHRLSAKRQFRDSLADQNRTLSGAVW